LTNWLTDPVVSFLLALLLALLTYLLQPRVKIRWTVTHGFIHHVKGSEMDARRVPPPGEEKPPPPAQDLNVWIRTLRVFNAGRSTARDLEITINWKPLSLSIDPQRQYFEQSNPSGRYILLFPTMGPREHVIVHMLDARELPLVLNVRSAEGFAKFVESYPQALYPRWVLVSVATLMIVGALFLAWAIIYGAILALRSYGVI
jgi:hypothetical protein